MAHNFPSTYRPEGQFISFEPWEPTHRHRKGGEYRILKRGKMEADLSPVVIYEAQDGTVWVRPEAEFDDGRFTLLR